MLHGWTQIAVAKFKEYNRNLRDRFCVNNLHSAHVHKCKAYIYYADNHVTYLLQQHSQFVQFCHALKCFQTQIYICTTLKYVKTKIFTLGNHSIYKCNKGFGLQENSLKTTQAHERIYQISQVELMLNCSGFKKKYSFKI